MKYLVAALLTLLPITAFAQGSVLQAGQSTGGHAPMYVRGGGYGQTVIQDSGPASGGAAGLGLSEFLQVNRSASSGSGSGPLGTHDCNYSAPTTSSGYYYLCFDAYASGGGLLAYGNAGTAPALPLTMSVNGSAYQFPFVLSGIVGPSTSTVGHLATWANTSGTQLQDSGTVTNDVTLSGAGTGLTVTNNASVGGALTSQTFYSNSGYNYSTTPANVYSLSAFYATPYVYGTTSGTINPVYYGIADQANSNFSDDFQISCNYVGTGGRNCFLVGIFNGQTLPSGNTPSSFMIGGQFYANNGAGKSGGTPGSCILGTSTCSGSIWAADSNAYLSNAGSGWSHIYSEEFDLDVDANSSVFYKYGIQIVLGNTDATRGSSDDAALSVAGTAGPGSGFLNVYDIVESALGKTTDVDSTLLGYHPVFYNNPSATTLRALYGVDWRYTTFTSGGCAYASPGFCVSPSGSEYAAGMVTTGSLQAQTATLASNPIINDAGAFRAIPLLTVQAPPSGTTATATVSTMGLSTYPGNGFFAITSNGTSGCTNNATVTVSGGTSSVTATGTATVVGGVVTSIAVATAGTYTVLPANPVTLTGSGCSGTLQATLTWGITGINTTAGSGYLMYPSPTVIADSSSLINHAAKITAVMTPTNSTLALNPSGGGLSVNGTAAVSCSGALSGSAVVTNGIVTHC